MRQEGAVARPAIRAWEQHWPLALTGLAMVLGAAVLRWIREAGTEAPRLFLLGFGLILVAQAIVVRWRDWAEAFEERLETAALLFVAVVTAALALLGPNKDWDSAHMVFKALMIAAGFGCVLVLLPTRPRRFGISFLVLFHFGGVFTAITMLPPPGASGAPAPFLANMAWVHIYRRYLEFFYMNNAYHFYSPEPGPPTLLWFKLDYANGKSEWYKTPLREQSPVNLHFTRMLSITESVNVVIYPVPNVLLEEASRKRLTAAQLPDHGIPTHPFVPMSQQYQPATPYSQRNICAIVRRVSREHAHAPGDESAPLVSLKFYRVRQNIMSASELAVGGSPLDKTLYNAFFQGEFFPNGELVNPSDPYLYWLIPILRLDQYQPDKVDDYVAKHADMNYNRLAIEKGPQEKQP